MDILEYLDAFGRSPFRHWFDRLNAAAAGKVTIALERIGESNLSNLKGVGGGVSEYRIDFGPGYRIYLGREGAALIILLGGGSKRRQQDDIVTAQQRWADYKRRRKE